MKRVLVTGGAGFIGAHLVKKLIDNNFNIKKSASNLIVNFLRQAIRDGYFHADLHQGNLFLNKDYVKTH